MSHILMISPESLVPVVELCRSLERKEFWSLICKLYGIEEADVGTSLVEKLYAKNLIDKSKKLLDTSDPAEAVAKLEPLFSNAMHICFNPDAVRIKQLVNALDYVAKKILPKGMQNKDSMNWTSRVTFNIDGPVGNILRNITQTTRLSFAENVKSFENPAALQELQANILTIRDDVINSSDRDPKMSNEIQKFVRSVLTNPCKSEKQSR